MKETEIAWAAGLWDGEGNLCRSILKKKGVDTGSCTYLLQNAHKFVKHLSELLIKERHGR